MSKSIVKTFQTQRVDKETGELLEYTSSMEVVKAESEPFFLTFSRQILALYGKSVFNATTKVLWKLLEYAEFNTGKVYMNAERRQDIMSVCSISRASYDRAIKELIDVDILTKNGNTYTIDESMFWRGDRKIREQLKNAKLRISFSPLLEQAGQEFENNRGN